MPLKRVRRSEVKEVEVPKLQRESGSLEPGCFVRVDHMIGEHLNISPVREVYRMQVARIVNEGRREVVYGHEVGTTASRCAPASACTRISPSRIKPEKREALKSAAELKAEVRRMKRRRAKK